MKSNNISEELDKKLILRDYRKLLRYSQNVINKDDLVLIKKAFKISLEAHKNMRRKSGEPYILHPLTVAQICIKELGLDSTSIICALLHDVVEDTDLSLEYLEKEFGKPVSKICDGLTKISGFFSPEISKQAENFKKMILTISDDLRVILIKLADRLHNMRTLDSMNRKSQIKIASESIYIYAPLAHRLGIFSIKTELEDLYLKYTNNKDYISIVKKLSSSKEKRDKFIKSFIRPIKKRTQDLDKKIKIFGRPKSIFSIYNKMKKQDITFEEVYDLFAIRIIIDAPLVEEKSVCWKIYSIVTDCYQPNPDRLKDWVSTPKSNGYESLHTTVMSNTGKWVEVQIRTQRMDDIAEKGFAAHWKYKENLKIDSKLEKWINNVREFLDQNDSNALELLEDFKGELYNDEVFVFTPKGDLITLPFNSTVLDFAFAIHSEIGFKCIGGKINQKLVPLNHIVKNGDQINILTSKNQKPSEDWLNIVVSSKSKSAIKQSFNKNQKNFFSYGKEILKRKLNNLNIDFEKNISPIANYFGYKNVVDFYFDIGKDKIALKALKNYKESIGLEKKKTKIKSNNKSKKTPKKFDNDNYIVLDDRVGLMDYKFSECCNPIPGDDVFGFITIKDGVKIHRTNCKNSPELLSKYAYRILKAKWYSKNEISFLSSLKIKGTDRVGIIDDISKIISSELKVNMKSISINSNTGVFEGKIQLYVNNTIHLLRLIKKLQKVRNVIKVSRFEE
tara:strand:+ start:11931 stop:14126 length:2196 start_codon:yes stop_codon:yes gene_type:complete